MTDSSVGYQKYIKRLHSGNPDIVIEAAHALGDSGDRRSVPVLIQILQTTSDPAIRDAAAIGLRELGDERALYPLVSLIMDPKTGGHRGTLIYALEEFDCSPFLDFLLDLVITGNFEVSHQAFLVIESIEVKVDAETIDLCLQKAQHALLHANEEKAELLRDLVDLLNKMKLRSYSGGKRGQPA